MTTLRDIPAIRAEADRRAQRAFDAEKVHADKHGGGDHWAYRGGFAARTPVSKAWAVEAQLDILTDLTDPDSRATVARLVGEALGWPVCETAPSLYWTPLSRASCDADGAPTGDDWPAGWWLQTSDGHMRFFSSEDWCPDDHTMIDGLPDGREQAAEALRLIALRVLGGES